VGKVVDGTVVVEGAVVAAIDVAVVVWCDVELQAVNAAPAANVAATAAVAQSPRAPGDERRPRGLEPDSGASDTSAFGYLGGSGDG
jgi:hypothetical protein